MFRGLANAAIDTFVNLMESHFTTTDVGFALGQTPVWKLGGFENMLRRLKRHRLAVISAATALGITMLFAPAAEASYNYRYFSGFSFQNQHWTSAAGTGSGGQVYAGIYPGGYGQNNYEYTATFDASTGYWLSSGSGKTDGWTAHWDTRRYNVYEQCWWNSTYYNPGQPAMYCDQFRD
ncbi:hypothetical protein BJG92_01225 [Arthrobacter sp. SO5]|nr:hypothetical protein [Arthrobacter sp. SO5]